MYFLPKNSLNRWYGLLALLSSVFAFQAMLFPRWPRVDSLLLESREIERALQRAGQQPTLLKTIEPYRSINIARSEVIGFRLNNDRELRLAQATVRERRNFQSAMINRDNSDIRLINRRLTQDMPYSAIGSINKHTALETCLVRQVRGAAAYGVTNDQLSATVDKLSQGGSTALRRIVGLEPNRIYGCVLVSLLSRNQDSIDMASWNKLLFALQDVLSK